MKKLIEMQKRRLRRKRGIRGKISGTPERPRLTVYKSNQYIYVQAVDDLAGHTIASVSNKEKEFADIKSNIEGAGKLGEVIAKRLNEKNVKTVVFDRNGYVFHGKVKALADSARKAGLLF
ncbi:MAG: 50S ribosomal protein L18 [Spirochaetia bacterium]|jgi:large subunit ribosomal protein L18|nr:50S ribosomal protein L18 [Spirochaetia bacterium]